MTKEMVPSTAPSYQILSTDISLSGSATGCTYIGASVYCTDTQKWYRVLPDLTLTPLVYNINASFSASDIQIGAVEIKDATSDNRAKVASASNIASGDIVMGVGVSNFPTTQQISGSLTPSEAHIGQIGGTGYIVSASFTGNGIATLHAINSAITPATGGLVEIPNAIRVNGGTAYVMDATLATSASGVTITPKLHFYSASTVTVAADSGSWIGLFADDVYKLGVYTLPAMTSPSGSSTNMSMATSTDTSITSHPAILVGSDANSKSIFVGIETTTAFTSSASQIWRIKLRMDQN